MSGRIIEEFSEGEIIETGGYTFEPATMIAFATEYDPQPIHIDESYADAGPFGGLIASGFQTVGIAFRLMVETGVLVDTSLGGPAMDEVRWLAPVRAGDTVTSRVTVLTARRSQSKPDRGILRLGFELLNQNGECVLTMQTVTMVKSKN